MSHILVTWGEKNKVNFVERAYEGHKPKCQIFSFFGSRKNKRGSVCFLSKKKSQKSFNFFLEKKLVRPTWKKKAEAFFST